MSESLGELLPFDDNFTPFEYVLFDPLTGKVISRWKAAVVRDEAGVQLAIPAIDVRSQRATTHTAFTVTGVGDQVIVSPSAGKSLRVAKLIFACNSGVSVAIKAGTTTQGQSTLLPLTDFGAKGGLAYDGDMYPLELGMDKSLVFSTNAAANITGFAITYEE